MLPRWTTLDRLEPHREIGPLFVRLIIGWHLIYGTQDNVFHAERMALWMVHRGRPYPENALALIMLFTSLFLLFHGPGRWALDRSPRHRAPAPTYS